MPWGPMAAAPEPDILAQGGCAVEPPLQALVPPLLLRPSPSALAALARPLKNVTCLKGIYLSFAAELESGPSIFFPTAPQALPFEKKAALQIL